MHPYRVLYVCVCVCEYEIKYVYSTHVFFICPYTTSNSVGHKNSTYYYHYYYTTTTTCNDNIFCCLTAISAHQFVHQFLNPVKSSLPSKTTHNLRHVYGVDYCIVTVKQYLVSQ